MFHVANLQDISNVIQKNVSCGQLTGYFSRYTEECFVWPSYGIFLKLYILTLPVAILLDVSYGIQNNVACGNFEGYVLTLLFAYYQS